MKIASVQVNGPHASDMAVVLEDGSKLEGIASISFEVEPGKATHVQIRVLVNRPVRTEGEQLIDSFVRSLNENDS